jgi:hypothetical protein
VVATHTCPICRKPVTREDPTTITAHVRGTPERIKAYFHADCYPGDDGTFFERVEPDGDDPDPL